MSVRVRFPSGAHQSLLEEILRGVFVLYSALNPSMAQRRYIFATKQENMAHKRTKEEFEIAAKESQSIAGMCRFMGLKPCGGNYRIMHNAIRKFKLDISHFTGQGWNLGLKFKPLEEKPISEILINGSTYQSFKLKRRLIKEGLKEHICECCGLSEWQNNPIPLELHHINGNNTDNRLENLHLLCPNCHALTESYRGKNKRNMSILVRNPVTTDPDFAS